MDIVIVANFCKCFDAKGNDRFLYIADNLCKNHNVEIITSDFSHVHKRHKDWNADTSAYKITQLHETGYPKNVCLKRFYSHYTWGKNVNKYLKKRKKADVVYCAVPSLTAARETAVYCKKNNIRFIVDVQDLWPEAFQMIFNIPVISNVIFAPFKFLANGIYKRADEIIAVSQTYVNRALQVNKKKKKGQAVFLGTDLKTFDENVQNNLVSKPDGEVWLAYCGTLGSSYDLTCAIDAIALLKDKCNKKLKFVVMGDGPRKGEFEIYAKEKGIYCDFKGVLPYDKMCGLLSACDININPITRGAAQSIINKHADYAASGHPVVSTQESQEYRNLVDDYKMGFNCRNNDASALAEKIWMLMNDDNLRISMGNNARRCAEERFDRRMSYQKIFNIIENWWRSNEKGRNCM
jgi:glycosyltransferase involved in cell wall biosynthesis